MRLYSTLSEALLSASCRNPLPSSCLTCQLHSTQHGVLLPGPQTQPWLGESTLVQICWFSALPNVPGRFFSDFFTVGFSHMMSQSITPSVLWNRRSQVSVKCLDIMESVRFIFVQANTDWDGNFVEREKFSQGWESGSKDGSNTIYAATTKFEKRNLRTEIQA